MLNRGIGDYGILAWVLFVLIVILHKPYSNLSRTPVGSSVSLEHSPAPMLCLSREGPPDKALLINLIKGSISEKTRADSSALQRLWYVHIFRLFHHKSIKCK